MKLGDKKIENFRYFLLFTKTLFDSLLQQKLYIMVNPKEKHVLIKIDK